MKKLELTPRLQAVASFVPAGARLADIGTDHAYLPVSLLLDGKISGAIAADLREGPLNRARMTAQEYHCTDKVSFRLCNGLADIKSYETDVISIAGMGGETIAEILSAAKWVQRNKIPVILQPMSTQPELRRWLYQNGYVILEEKLVQEGDTLYVVMLAQAGESDCLTPAEEWAGQQRQGINAPLRAAYLNMLLEKLGWALSGMARSKEGTASQRYHELDQIRAGLEEMKKEWELWQQ